MSRYKITTDLFILPYKNGQSLLYAPLAGFAGLVNTDLVNFLAEIENIEEETLEDGQKETLDFLIQKGLVNGLPHTMPVMDLKREFSPDKLCLFPTNGCNLNCRSCYASAEHFTPKTMDWDVATNTIEFFVGLLKRQNRK